MKISVVIPLLNEAESLPELYEHLTEVLGGMEGDYEIIFVDDGSSDDSWEIIRSLSGRDRHVKGIKFSRNFGKSQALDAGFKKATGDVVVTMDADLQDDPAEIPGLVAMITDEGYDMVSCWKKKRKDPVLSKNLPSKLFNWAARTVSGIRLHDFNCGLKAYKGEVTRHIRVYGEMHRYIPFLAKQAGFERIGERPVRHHARKYGQTKFGSDRFIKGVLDLITLWFHMRFSRRPMYLFGGLGLLMFLIGGLSVAVILGVKAYKLMYGLPTHLVTDRPWFYISIASMLLGSQFFLAGFLGELILQQGERAGYYHIQEETD
ncbi:MAG: glycosyltransferase family 2 protein [Chlorobi bacterium]|nr:glycosyltransferase family 2 protein [Chlorobiota bacterium]